MPPALPPLALPSESVRLVRDSWALVAPLGGTAAALFYERLFVVDPALRRLFRSPMELQGQRLLQMLGAAVQGLDDPAALVPQLRQLGRRHADYGVCEGHYTSVGQALIDTLQLALGDAFTAPVRNAWREVYGFVAAQMQLGMAVGAPGPASRALQEVA